MAFHSVSDSQVRVRIYFNIFLLIIWASCYTSVTGREGGQVISQTVLTKVGDDVVLPCHVKSTNLESADSTLHNVEWTRRDLKPPYVHVLQSGRYKFEQMNPLYKQRTALFHDRFSGGNVSLKLFRVQLSDEGKFKCLVPPNISGSLIQLLVGAVSQPKISFNGTNYEGLSCDSGCWYPEPEVSWLDSEGNHINDQSPMIKTSSTDSPNCYFVQRTVAVRRGKNITCRVNLPHINYTTTVETPEAPQASARGAESTGPNGGVIAGMAVLLVALILMLMGYIYWKKKQTGKQEDKNKAAKFVMQHRAKLILEVSKVMDILHSPTVGSMVTPELYGEIKEEKTSMDQMMRLYREILQPRGVEAKAAFYNALKEYEPKLFKTLEDPATPRPKDLWSKWKSSPVLCDGKDTQVTQGPGSDEQSLTKNAQFVMKNRAQLIQRVSRVMAILDSQEVQTKISPELRTKIEAQKTRPNQMRILYTEMEGDKDLFYKVLKKHEPHLLEWLENPPTRDAVDLTPEEKAHFVENRKHLITYVSKVMAILDDLGSKVHREIYDEIQEEETSMDQMWILYRQILEPAGTNVRAAFYNALKVHQPYLLKTLDEEKVNHGDGDDEEKVNHGDCVVSMDMTDTDPQALESAPLLGSSGPEGENPPPGSNVEKEKDPEGDPPSQTGSDFEKGKDPEGDLPTGSDFEKGKATEPGHVVSQLALNRREKMISAIRDVLSTEDVTVQKMRKLEFLDSRLAQDIFHKVLKDLEKCLLDNLNDPPCWISLKELDDKKFQIFKLYLQDSKNLEGLEPLPESLLQNTDRMKTASLIMQTYHSKEDQTIITNVLEKIKQNDQEMLPDESTPQASAYHFVTLYRNDLIKRVKMIDPILDLLLAKKVITPDDYSKVTSKPTTMEKMVEIYTLLHSRRDKDIFYSGLQEHERFLLDDLKNPPWIIDTLKKLDENEFKDFKSCLQQSDNLEGLQPLPKSLLENTDRTDTANLIVKTYGSKGSTIVKNVLKKINKSDLKSLPKDLEGDPPSPTESVSDKGKGLPMQCFQNPEGESPLPTENVSDKGKGPKLKLKGLPKQRFQRVSFVDKEKDSLIKRVTKVELIVNHLVEKKVFTDAQKRDMMDMPKTVDQMKKLYALLNDPDAKTTFYEGLKIHEQELLKSL